MLTLGSSSVPQLLKILAPVLIILWSLSYFGLSRSHYSEVVRQFRSRKAVFVADFLDNEIDGRFNGAGIERLCASKTWTPGLIMGCDAAPGGIGEVRNAQLHCIRFAIEAGAELILPEIVRRADNDITQLTPDSKGTIKGVPLDYFFDMDHFHHVMSTHCPQMKIHQSLNDLYNVPGVLDPIKFNIPDTNGDWVNGTVLAKPGIWGQQFKNFLETKSPAAKRRYPMRVQLESTLYVYPTVADVPDVTRNFGRILRIRTDARRLAASALFNLVSKFNLNMDPRRGYHPESFVGVHLRTEQDVQGKFPEYLNQASYYLNYLVLSKCPVAYLASGATAENITSFAERARDFNVTVVTKQSILDADELATLSKFSWDQRALVDYEIMLRAGLLTGLSQSSFAWNLALRRSHAFGNGHGSPISEADAASIQWQDPYSTLYGQNSNADAMRATIWP